MWLDELNDYIIKFESAILTTYDWNLNISNGYEMMAMLLKFSNNDFDFNAILNEIHGYASQALLSTDLDFDNQMKILALPQSTLYIAVFKLFCHQQKWQQFYDDFKALIQEDIDLDFDNVDSCYDLVLRFFRVEDPSNSIEVSVEQDLVQQVENSQSLDIFS